ncbi:MAG: class I SAM-dependent methyltransferase [Candidatus Hermodarchaeota archaeon]
MGEINYDQFSQIYDLSRGANPKTVSDLVKFSYINQNSLLLDLGCGTGNYTNALKQFVKFIIGLDLSLGMIKNARVKFPNLEYTNANVMSLPFRSKIFNGLYLVQVIHHIENKIVLLEEAHRVLRKNGSIAIHTCSHDQINTYWYTYYFPEGLKAELKRFLDVNDIISLLKKTGFSKIGVRICYYDTVILNQIPENYLKKNFRDGDSFFALMKKDEIEAGCKKLQDDIRSGAINKILKVYKKRVDLYGGSLIIYGQKT